MKRENLNFRVKMEGGKKALASFINTNRLNLLDARVIRLGLIDIATKRNSEILIDFSGINFIDSSVVDTLNLLSRLARRFGSSVMLTHVNAQLGEMFDLIKIYSVLNIRILKQDITEKEAA